MAIRMLVEAKSDAAYFRALDRCLTTRAQLSEAYEQLHQELETVTTGADDTRWDFYQELFNRLPCRDRGYLWFVKARPDYRVVVDDARSAERTLPARQPDGLPVWCTNTFVGLPAPTWVGSGDASTGGLLPISAGQDVGLLRSQPYGIALQISNRGGRLRAALLRFLDFLRSMVRLFDRAIEAACLIHLIVRSGLRHRPNTLAFALIMLATCRRYGRRSESDDHASLRNRRHLVIRGSCPQT